VGLALLAPVELDEPDGVVEVTAGVIAGVVVVLVPEPPVEAAGVTAGVFFNTSPASWILVEVGVGVGVGVEVAAFSCS
jgi:hypothetical protein